MSIRGIHEKIARHRAFWTLADVDRPLLGVNVDLPAEAMPPSNRALDEDTVLQPEHCLTMMDSDPLFYYRERDKQLDQIEVDLFRPAAPPLASLWLEAGIGMPLKIAGGSIWPLPLLGEDEPLENLRIGVRDEWIQAIAQGTDRLADQLDGCYPMMGAWMRAPADMVTALIGTSRACVELHDHPDEMLRLIESLAAAWRQIAAVLQPHVPAWEGGYVLSGGNGIYAPAAGAVFSEDSTVLVSMATFRRFFLPADKRLSQTFPYGMVHRHAASLQNILGLLELERNWLIQITMDQMGPTVPELMPVFHQLQTAGRPMIVYIYGMRTDRNPEEEITALARELSPRGLCIIIHTDNLAQAAQLADLAMRARWQV